MSELGTIKEKYLSDKGQHLEKQLEQYKCLVHQLMSGLQNIKEKCNDCTILEQINYLDGLTQGHCAYGIKDWERTIKQ